MKPPDAATPDAPAAPSNELERVRRELALNRRVSAATQQAGDLGALAMALVEMAADELPSRAIALYLADAEGRRLAPEALWQEGWYGPRLALDPDPRRGFSLAGDELGRAVAEGELLLLDGGEGQSLPRLPSDLPQDAACLLLVPLEVRHQALGAFLAVGHHPGAYSRREAHAARRLASQAAPSLANLRLIERLGQANQRLAASELSARQARRRLEHMLDTAADLILITDAGGRVTYANQAAASFGLMANDLLGLRLEEVFDDPERAGRLIAAERPATAELGLATDGGPSFTTLASATPLTESGEILVIARDITQRKALERQLVQAEKLASVGILAAGVAHEIGNPLSAISGYAQLLGSDDTSPEERREFAGAIAEQAERIDKIIRDLLDYSRPTPGAGQATDVVRAVESVLNMFFTTKRLKKHRLSIVRDLGRDLPKVAIDRDQLQQVVLNLVMNAAQAMGEGGNLVITGREEEGWVLLSFSDSGPGIPADHLPLLFDPFFTTKAPGEGTGLGLAICERIVRQAGGRIAVSSRPGQGASFTVRLPGATE